MKLPSWILKIAAAAVIPIIVGVGTALSAPSPALDDAAMVADDTYQPGEFGVDYAAVTGPVGSALEGAPKRCEDATWPNIPSRCLDGSDNETPQPVRIAD